MAIRFLDSCGDHYETGDISRKWQLIEGSVEVVPDGRNGKCLKLGSSAGIGRKIGTFSPGPVLAEPKGVGFWARDFVFLAGQNLLVKFFDSSGPISGRLLYNSGKLQIWGPGLDINTNQVSANSKLFEIDWTPPAAGIWYPIEFEFKIKGSISQWALHLNGLTVTDNIQPLHAGPVVIARFLSLHGEKYLDDIYINDNNPETGDFSRSLSVFVTPRQAIWSVGVLKPNAEGLHLNWAPDPPSNNAHYTLVNEIPPDLEASGLKSSTDDIQETYHVEDVTDQFDVIWAAQNVLSLRGQGVPPATGGEWQFLYSDIKGNPEDVISSPIYGQQAQNDPGNLVDWDFWVRCSSNPISHWTRDEFNEIKWGFRHRFTNEIKVSQGMVEVLVPGLFTFDPPTTPIQLGLTEHIGFTKLWKITRKDNVAFHFTDHNADLINPVDALTYTPLDSLATSAHQRTKGIDPNSIEMRGIISTMIYNDFLAGKFIGARVTEYLLDWKYPWAGVFLITTFYMSSTSFTAARWTSEGSSLSLPLLLPKGEIYGRTCRYILGDARCKVDLSLLEEINNVLSVNKDHTSFEAVLPQTIDAFGNARGVSNYWAFGNIVWISGENIGLKSEIRSDTIGLIPEQVTIILQIPLPFTIVAGDTYTITPGCDKLYTTCKDKFENPTDGDIACGNTKNFGGFPTIPGADGIFAPITGAQRVQSGDFLDNTLLSDLIDFLIGQLN